MKLPKPVLIPYFTILLCTMSSTTCLPDYT